MALDGATKTVVETVSPSVSTEMIERREPERDRLLGVPVDRVTMDGAVQFLARRIAEGRRSRVLVTNANKAWQANRDEKLCGILDEAELVVPEWAMVWAAARLRRSGIHHIGGITLMIRLLEEAPVRGWSVYFLGSKHEVVEALVARLRRERPELRIAGYHHGYLDEALDRKVRDDLGRVQPDILFVAMGSPLQEFWISRLPATGGPKVSIGVGGSFDVLAGLKKDAPAWARGRGLEWIYRLVQDPRRLWRRYLVTNTWFVWSVLHERLRGAQ